MITDLRDCRSHMGKWMEQLLYKVACAIAHMASRFGKADKTRERINENVSDSFFFFFVEISS